MKIGIRNLGATLGLLMLFSPCLLHAELELPYLIGDGMVVQRGQLIPVWGQAAPGTNLLLEFDGEQKDVIVAKDGHWRTEFSVHPAGGPFELSIKGDGQERDINDIWVGDVWVCSGQSNMEWVLRNVINGEQEVLQATDSLIRHFEVPHTWAVSPESQLAGGAWEASSPDVAGDFTAVGYFFAKNLRQDLDVPIGLINSNWGGSNIESWMEAGLLGMTQAEATLHIESLIAAETVNEKDALEKVSQWPLALVDKLDGSDADWSAIDLDESDWTEIEVPVLWEMAGFEGMDGIAWYRKTFNLSEAQASQGLVLSLAKIDDNDVTWVNGNKVGETAAYDRIRRYEVASGYLQAGENVIAIRVDDTGGGGGIYAGSDLLYFEVGGEQVSLAGNWKFKPDKVRVSLSEDRNHTSTALYNKMMAPLFNVPVKGVLWYQGESNANFPKQAYDYRDQFKMMITDWRSRWGNADMPFLWVQLANFESGRNVEALSPWAIMRESQAEALSLSLTGQAITIDIGTANNIHPRNKQDVGKRLALEALAKVYGNENIVFRGPVLENFSIEDNKLVLHFGSESQLTLRQSVGAGLNGFTVAGKDQKFHVASARLDGETVIVWSDAVARPVAVRYAWNDNPEEANLMGTSGLPAEPFRTDSWPVY